VHRAARIAAVGHGGQVLVSASTAALLPASDDQSQGPPLLDLGEHRLKDLSAPERIYQLGNGEFPPLKSLYRTNLPVPATPFLGREHELAEVVELLTRDDLRLLTLTGPGGTGKTRLALQAAAEASETFPDGVYWVPLAPLRDPQLVLSTLAQALAVSEEPDRELEETLTAHLAGKRLLLLLDNVEHLLPAVAEPIAALRDANGSRLLVTSRERLRIGGEQAWPVPPLEPADGTALFAARARAVDPAFAPTPAVGELCGRLDELPLAIELAAARSSVLSPAQILERLAGRLDLLKGDRDADPRQQTLRATIEWSHDLLTAEEQRLFARLSVFRGGCTLEAAEEVCEAGLDTLQSLLDKSLLRKRDAAGEPRYWMLETIREYAIERLEESGAGDEVRRRHAEWFLALAEEAEPYAREVDRAWLDRLELELDNLRAALDWLERAGETQLVLRLAGALVDLWGARGHFAEGRRRLEDALAADESPTAARANALNAAADLAIGDANVAAARLRAGEALTLHRRLGNTWGAAASLLILGHAAADDRDFVAARDPWEESLQLWREVEDRFHALVATRMLSWAYAELGEEDRAHGLMEDVLGEARVAGYKHVQVHALESFAIDAALEGRVEEATSLLKEAYTLNRELGDQFREAIIVCRFARVLAVAGRAETAARVLAAGETLYKEMAASPMGWLQRGNEQALGLIRERLDEAAIAEAFEQGRTLTADEAVALALGELE
jgi:predicted ATPase